VDGRLEGNMRGGGVGPPTVVMEAGRGRPTWVVEARRHGAPEAGSAAESEVGRVGSLRRRICGGSSGGRVGGRQGTGAFCTEDRWRLLGRDGEEKGNG
jgi:hypothetical protein